MPYTKEEQREYNKQYRATRRNLKLCEYCGKKDEQTMNGKCYCRECAKKIKIRNSTGEARAKAKKNVFEGTTNSKQNIDAHDVAQNSKKDIILLCAQNVRK